MNDSVIIICLIVLAALTIWASPANADVTLASVISGAFGYIKGGHKDVP